MMLNAEFASEFARATGLRDAERFDQAIELLQRLHVERPESIHVLLVLGGIHLKQGRYALARTYFSAAAASAPDLEIASTGLFHALLRAGQTEEAFSEARRYLTLRPDSPEYNQLVREMTEPE